jgi:CRP-like cAMP-binding protein
MQLKRGARETLDIIYSDLETILNLSHDPLAVEQLARRIRDRVRDDVEPRLQRAAPTVEQRLETLERQMAELQERKIVQFRKAE